MSFTHTNAPASTNARPIAAPTPLPPPVTSARRPSQLISSATGCSSDFHDDRDDDRSPSGPLVDELAQRTACVPSQRVEVERAFRDRAVDRDTYRLLGLLDEVFGLGGVHPAAGHDLRPGDD